MVWSFLSPPLFTPAGIMCSHFYEQQKGQASWEFCVPRTPGAGVLRTHFLPMRITIGLWVLVPMKPPGQDQAAVVSWRQKEKPSLPLRSPSLRGPDRAGRKPEVRRRDHEAISKALMSLSRTGTFFSLQHLYSTKRRETQVHDTKGRLLGAECWSHGGSSPPGTAGTDHRSPRGLSGPISMLQCGAL